MSLQLLRMADLDLAGKRVGVIGNGSTGNQVITATAPVAEHLISFQRTPQYSVPAGNRELTPEQLLSYKQNRAANWAQVHNSGVAMGFEESTLPTFSVSPEERERIYQRAWDEGGGFRFMFETFGDIATDAAANEEAAAFIRRKIAEIVTDPETRRNLTPTDLYAKRPLCDSGFYETFNRPNVTLVNVKENPISELTAAGVRTADGTVREVDVLVCARGFDAVDGNYRRLNIRGRTGQTLGEKWQDGPTSYLGVATSGFPNMFMIWDRTDPSPTCPRRSRRRSSGSPTPSSIWRPRTAPGWRSRRMSNPRGRGPAPRSPTPPCSRRRRRGSSAPTSRASPAP